VSIAGANWSVTEITARLLRRCFNTLVIEFASGRRIQNQGFIFAGRFGEFSGSEDLAAVLVSERGQARSSLLGPSPGDSVADKSLNIESVFVYDAANSIKTR
jgi:hypothetical protein